ncbi:hypothetical protein [Paenibacillus apiarius]|uniref:Uncharacterized protein n=1 Tax=Paenibacillus apiarius TaxID=46240 RepID=A0ABT4DNW3_9BACL|nr:hypothetical protein [Paenibacillus apiarius]MCY9512802.1 hypothetical protein [Paenibacillus apiarius]MCY9519054.1 hypothetical protein [Paenibacillus apiarius]MCY9550863.1 hypothetical protein [Paenibacillus apiarius]MCY9559703.1 hypothetical protein [Paenibacillus apiarius]MCY9681946.1 hypothetical protein [Paenibacillus apiarius]
MKKLAAVMALTLAFSAVSATAAFAAETGNTTGAVSAQTDTMDLKQKTAFYEAVGGQRIGYLAPQKVGIEEATTDNSNITWYKIHTWVGYTWMKDPNASTKTVVIPNETAFYKSPNGDRLGLLGSQTANIISERMDDSGFIWFQINTYKGKYWIIDPAQQVEQVTLKKATTLYNAINGKKVGSLSPQTVKIKNEKKDGKGQLWAQVVTWKGDLWIKR